MIKRQKTKRTNNDLQNTTQKTKDCATRTAQKPGGGLRCFGWVHMCTHIVIIMPKQYNVIYNTDVLFMIYKKLPYLVMSGDTIYFKVIMCSFREQYISQTVFKCKPAGPWYMTMTMFSFITNVV